MFSGYNPFFFIVVCFFLQFLLSAFFLSRILTYFFRSRISLSFKGLGFFFPILYFSARDFSFLFHGNSQDLLKKDRFYFHSEKVCFWINPIFLLLGCLRISGLYLEKPLLYYFNRQFSHEKKHILPKPKRLQFSRICIHRGKLFVEDETSWPLYQVSLSRIEVRNMTVDIAIPAFMFFQIQRATAQLAGGVLRIKKSGKEGIIQLQNIRWKEIANFKKFPFGLEYLLLLAHFQEKGKEFLIDGLTSGAGKKNINQNSSLEQMSNKIAFSFKTKSEEYQTTLDLGIQKLIENILHSTQTNWFSKGLAWGGQRIFDLFKRKEK